jgi:hypothetical protein
MIKRLARLAALAALAAAVLTAAPVAAAPVKTKAVIEKITRVGGEDTGYEGKGRITAPDEACLNKREVVILHRLGPPWDSNSVMNVVETDKRGRWSATWTTGDLEQYATGIHYIEVEKLKKGKRKCSFARSKEYTVPTP